MAGTTLDSNLGSGSTVYNCCTGWTITGTGSIGESFTAANQFQVTTSGSVSEIDFAVGFVSGFGNSFYLDIDSNNAGQPGSVLASFTNLSSSSTEFGTCCGLVSITGISGLTLTAGTNYWMVIGPTSSSDNTYDAWNFSNSAMGTDEYSNDGGKTWVSNGTQPQGAFDIIGGGGGTTPEPTSSGFLAFGWNGSLSARRGSSLAMRSSQVFFSLRNSLKLPIFRSQQVFNREVDRQARCSQFLGCRDSGRRPIWTRFVPT